MNRRSRATFVLWIAALLGPVAGGWAGAVQADDGQADAPPLPIPSEVDQSDVDQPDVGQPGATVPASTPREPAWPAALRYRNARYANLARTTDLAGDARERLLVALDLTRRLDVLGDLEELRRERVVQSAHEAIEHAVIARTLDRPSDERQEQLLGASLARRHGDFRRNRDLGGDYAELAIYKRNLIWHGEPGRSDVMLAEQRHDPSAAEHELERGESRDQTAGDLADERARERDDERRDADERHNEGRILRGEDIDLDREEERIAASLDATLEREAEREAAREENQLERELDKDQTRVEGAEERSAEREQERSLDREEDQVLQQAEKTTTLD